MPDHFVPERELDTGRIGGRQTLELPGAPQPRVGWRFAWAMGVIALVLAVIAIDNRGAHWTVLATTGDGIAIVDQSPVPLGHVSELERRLHPGARVVSPVGAEIELASASGLVIQVLGGTEFILPASPGRWFGRRVAGAVRRGEIRLTTGPAFHGARLRFDTPEAVVEAAGATLAGTGTTLAVICEPGGTCVCVCDGPVRVGAKGKTLELVPNGRQRFVFRDGRPTELADIREAEIRTLVVFRDRLRSRLEGAEGAAD